MAQALDLLEPPFQAGAEAGFGLALGRLIGELLIGAEVQHAREVGEQVGWRMVTLGLVVGDAAAGDTELIGELVLGEAGGLAQGGGEARPESLFFAWVLVMSRLVAVIGLN